MKTVKRRSSPPKHQAAPLAVVAGVTVLLALGTVATVAMAASSAPTREADSGSGSSLPVDVRDMEVPPGKAPVASHEGGIAGFVDAEALERPGGYPPLDIGTEQPVSGLDVTDESGVLVGYFLEGYGFVDLETVETPGAVDALLGDQGVEGMSPEQRREYEEFVESQSEPGDTGEVDPGEG